MQDFKRFLGLKMNGRLNNLVFDWFSNVKNLVRSNVSEHARNVIQWH